ncbi:ATP-dependent helicase HrpB [Desulfosarcina alkanivorans]|uniref:ATP-dependent helicase HrpB n=1 Tax=Desulfosarcina alkanivorans TaxID=571177 RepID=A0A5K7YSA1_9BACT|nr:ATP-dependent helicase HrpB [Desulfosarcina alkanivorans]BBO70829.1 ATP-dependent helicase HrpB [Desulfosarcina alkanivorans]
MNSGTPADPIGRLPVAAIFDDLKTALGRHPSTVLVAPPGAGKTTAVPLVLLNEGWLSGRRMLLLAPRRLAARAAAHRMADLLDQRVGRTVGYRVRMESRVGPETRIEVITEGVLTRMLQHDPSLAGVGLVIFDEFHERSLDADLGLALCRDIQGVLNEDLRLLVMSATLDPAAVTALLGDAPLIRCKGRTFPVETRHVDRPPSRPVERAVAGVIRQSAAADEGNLLVFLPGAPEIRRVARLLDDGRLPKEWMVAPLYGSLPRNLQDAAIAPPPAGRHKIVLATAIAETSLTIEQIRVVVDSGLQRAPRFDPVSGMTRLVTLPVSQASADQRRGRAGRLEPGICYRLWHEAAHHALVPYNRPEILDSDLTGLALELAVWGLDAPDALGWLDGPPAAAFSLARRLLLDLGGLDEGGKITVHGRLMADLPLHPRLAHMILAAREMDMGVTACEMAAILSERDPLHFTGRERDADLRLRLDALQALKAGRPFRHQGCQVDRSAMHHLIKVSAVLEKQSAPHRNSNVPPEPGRLLAWAYPDRIARQRPGRPGRFLLTSGRGAFFDTPEPLSACDFLVAAHLDGDRREARIFMAAAIDKEHLMDQFAHRMRWRETVSWDDRRKAVSADRQLVLGALTLETEPLGTPAPEAVLAAMIAGIRSAGIAILPWTRRLRVWQARVMLLRSIQAEGGPWPDISDTALEATLEDWLAPYLSGMKRLKDLGAADFSNAIRNRLSWKQQRRMQALAPTHIRVPSGSRLPVDYSEPIPVLAVRIQEMFGSAATPAIANGRMPVMLHLLSPAGRPAQITRDLAGFWHNGYPEVKKELKGRYPRHAWPEDPLGSTPTSRARPRKSN